MNLPISLKIVYLSIELIFSVSVLLLNGLFMISLVKTRSFHTPSNTVLGCLSFCDLLIGTHSFLLWILNIVSIVSGQSRDDEKSIVFQGFMSCIGYSTLFIIFVNFDRYVAICHPFKYLLHATSKLYVIITASTCLVYAIATAVSYTLFSISNSLHREVTFAIMATATTTILIFCNWKILIVIRRHRLEISSVARNSDEQHSGFQNERKRYHVIVLLVILFFICKLPRIIYSFNIQHAHSSMSFYILGISSTNFLLLNSLLNPLVYYFRIKLFRDAMKELLCFQWLIQYEFVEETFSIKRVWYHFNALHITFTPHWPDCIFPYTRSIPVVHFIF